MKVGSMEYTELCVCGGGGGAECSRKKKQRKMRVLGKGTWIREQAEHPWASSAVVNYLW